MKQSKGINLKLEKLKDREEYGLRICKTQKCELKNVSATLEAQK